MLATPLAGGRIGLVVRRERHAAASSPRAVRRTRATRYTAFSRAAHASRPQALPRSGPSWDGKRARSGGKPSSASRRKATSSSQLRSALSPRSRNAKASRNCEGESDRGASKWQGTTRTKSHLVTVSSQARAASASRLMMICMIGATDGLPPAEKASKATSVDAFQVKWQDTAPA